MHVQKYIIIIQAQHKPNMIFPFELRFLAISPMIKYLLIKVSKGTNKNVEMLPTIAEHASGLPTQLNN